MPKDDTKRDGVEVSTPRGTFVGFQQRGVRTFRGVPYASCSRFCPPQRIEHYGHRDCVKSGPCSPQPEMFSASGFLSLFSAGHGHIKESVPRSMSETECLNLQIYVPGGDAHPTCYPTFVFIHGGAFLYGANKEAMYQQAWGSKLAAQQRIAVVLVNYRLSCFGFCKVPGGISNLGLRDVVAALRFIQEDGACFGLDSQQVTVGGESAGGMITGALLRVPSAQGLFRRAFIMSGGTGFVMPEEDADVIGAHLASKVDVHTADAMKLLRAAFEMVGKNKFGQMPFQPVIDGDFVVDPPCARGIDVLLGVCQNEALLFVPLLPLDLMLRSVRNSTDVAKRVMRVFDDMGCELSEEDVAGVIERGRNDYAGTAKDALRRLLSVFVFEAACVATAEHLKESNRVYAYRNMLGPGHAGELGYIFGNWNMNAMTRLVSGLPARPADDANKRGVAMEQLWGKIVRSFVTEGSPADTWPHYDERGLAWSLSPSGPRQVALATPTVSLVRSLQAGGKRPFGVRLPQPPFSRL